MSGARKRLDADARARAKRTHPWRQGHPISEPSDKAREKAAVPFHANPLAGRQRSSAPKKRG